MIVVCDTSPICYLILIGEVELLASLFGEIAIPPQIRTELMAPGAPAPVREWIGTPPGWLRIVEAPSGLELKTRGIHPGERAALALARHLEADLLVIDDKLARQVAAELGFRVTGLLGVLDLGAKAQQVDLGAAVQRLSRTSFRVAPVLLQSLLRRHARS